MARGQSVKFYDTMAAALNPIQRRYEEDPRRSMAASLRKSSMGGPPITSHMQGLASLAETGLGAYMENQALEEKEAASATASQQMSEALAAATPQIMPTYKDVTLGSEQAEMLADQDAGMYSEADPYNPGGMPAVISSLEATGNPDQNPAIVQLQMGEIARQQAAREAAKLREQEIEDYERKAKIDLKNPSPPSGRQSTVLQIADRLTGLHNALVVETRPEVKKQIQAKIDRLNIIIAKDPEVLRAQAYGKGKGAGKAKTEAAPDLEASKAIGKGMGTQNMELYNTTQNALETLQKSTDLIAQLKTSDATTGFGADMITGINKLKATMGSGDAYKKVTDTQVLNAMMGSEVFGLMKSLGVGARGLDTPAEREFMREVLTGVITLNKDTLIKMAEIRQAIAQRAIDRWNKKSNAGELDLFYQATGIAKKDISFAPANSVNSSTPPLPSGFVVQN